MKIFNIIRIWLAVKFPSLRNEFLSMQEREKLCIIQIRNCFVLFGHDLSDVSDDDLKKGILESSKAVSNFGISVSQAADAMRYAINDVEK